MIANRIVPVPAKASFSSCCGSTYIWNGGAPECETKLVNPASAPQNTPRGTSAGRAAAERRCRIQVLTQNPMPTSPTRRPTNPSDTRDATAQPNSTPASPAGMRIRRLRAE